MSRASGFRDQIAIVGAGRVPYSRDSGMSGPAMAAAACIAALRDAGLSAADVDGVCGSKIVSDIEMQEALGLPRVTWGATMHIPFAYQLIEAANALYAGACQVAIVYHAMCRAPGRSDGPAGLRSRESKQGAYGPMVWKARSSPAWPEPGQLVGGVGYASWAARYLHLYGRTRAELGLIALNNRAHAMLNDEAVLRGPLSMDDYLAAPMIREPLGLYDVDIPVDGADAFVLTTSERAADLCETPVLIHAATTGRVGAVREDQLCDLEQTGQRVVVETLRERSEIDLIDVDVLYCYDGFSIINLMWLESIGYAPRGEAADLLRASWDESRGSALLGGHTPMNPHGGSLSEGGSQGSGIVQDAVRQLRGRAGRRQVPDAHTVLATIGGFVWNAAALVLRTTSGPE